MNTYSQLLAVLKDRKEDITIIDRWIDHITGELKQITAYVDGSRIRTVYRIEIEFDTIDRSKLVRCDSTASAWSDTPSENHVTSYIHPTSKRCKNQVVKFLQDLKNTSDYRKSEYGETWYSEH